MSEVSAVPLIHYSPTAIEYGSLGHNSRNGLSQKTSKMLIFRALGGALSFGGAIGDAVQFRVLDSAIHGNGLIWGARVGNTEQITHPLQGHQFWRGVCEDFDTRLPLPECHFQTVTNSNGYVRSLVSMPCLKRSLFALNGS